MSSSWLTRICAAVLILGSSAVFDWASHPRAYPDYYFICAIFDASLVFLYRMILGKNSLVRDLQIINLISIVNQAFGFTLYMLYFPPMFYNHVLITLQIIEWLRLLMVRTDDRLPTNNWRLDLVRYRLGRYSQRYLREKNL